MTFSQSQAWGMEEERRRALERVSGASLRRASKEAMSIDLAWSCGRNKSENLQNKLERVFEENGISLSIGGIKAHWEPWLKDMGIAENIMRILII